MGYIYSITNNTNNKKYIGLTSQKYPNNRWSAHKIEARNGNKNPIYRAIRKYGVENFTFKIIIKNIPKNKIGFYERLWIKKLNTIIPNGYNITPGGEQMLGIENPMYGKTPWNKGIKRTQEVKDKISSHYTIERRKKLSEKFSGENNPRYGKPSTFSKNDVTKEFIDKCRISQKTCKSVYMINKNTDEILKEFISLGQCAEWIRNNTKFIKADYSTINKVCKGINNTAYGYKWSFVEKV